MSYTTRHRLRTTLTISLWSSVAIITLLIVAGSMAFAFLQNVQLSAVSKEGFLEYLQLSKCNIYKLLLVEPVECRALYEKVDRPIVLGLIAILRVVVGALIVSLILVRLLSHRDLFIAKSRINLSPCDEKSIPRERLAGNEFWEKEGGWELRCRLYNATRLSLLNVTFKVKLRRPCMTDTEWRLKNHGLKVASDEWAIVLPFVPITIRIPLSREDLGVDGNGLRPKTIQGFDYLPSSNDQAHRPRSFIVINMEGRIHRSDQSFVESLWWPIENTDSICRGRELPVNVVPGHEPMATGSTPDRWEGWNTFDSDKVTEDYIFAYGSLMKDWLGEAGSIANLRGYRRNWGATMDNTKRIADYKYYAPADGTDGPATVSFLNVAKADDANAFVTGLVRKARLEDIMETDRRERNYVRVEVTDDVVFLREGERPKVPYRVWTYTATLAAQSRSQGMERTIANDYLKDYEQAGAAIRARAGDGARVDFDYEGTLVARELVRMDC